MKKFLSFFLMILFMPLSQAAEASMQVQELAFVEGKQYLLRTPSEKELPLVNALLEKTPKGQVTVWFFFNYGCPVCNLFEPKVSAWYDSKKEQHLMAFSDVPVIWDHPGWQTYARAFYTEESLGVLDEGHRKLFTAIHGNGEDIKPQNLASEAALETFFHKELGIKPQDFKKHYNSFAVNMKMHQSQSLMQAYQIAGVPSFVIAGKYYADTQTAGGMDQLLEVVNFLVNKETFTQDEEKIDFNAVTDGTTK